MDKDLKKNICNNIKRIMEYKGVTQLVLANKLQVTQPYISQLLSGNINPTVETLDRIASALGITFQELFQDITFPFTWEDNSFVVIKCSELKRAFMEWDREIRTETHEEETVSEKEAIRMLGISYGTIVKYKKSGLLHPIKIGKNNYFRKYEIEKLLKTGTK